MKTSELAALIGVKPYVLNKWKCHGHLTLGPKGVAGQGRGNECSWSMEAVDEAIKFAFKKRSKAMWRGDVL